MIRQVILAIAIASAVVAQRPASSDLVDLLVFGNHTLRDGGLKGFEPELQRAVDEHIQRAARYQSKLPRPQREASELGMVYASQVGYERLLAASTTDPRGPALAAAYVGALRPCYEWEGYHDCPEAEAVFADRYQATHPDGPFKDFLPLLAAHRWLCAADAYDYEKKPEDERRARALYVKGIDAARKSASLLVRAGAEGLVSRGTCLARYPEGHIVTKAMDASGAPVPGVTITASPSSGAALKCVTDVRGMCSLLGIRPQHYGLEATLSGFITQRSDVDLSDGQFYQWNVKMPVGPLGGVNDLLERVTMLTGPNPMSCGKLRWSSSVQKMLDESQPALACAIEAAGQRKPFWISNQQPGIDSIVVDGLVGTSDGAIYRFTFDSNPCGGGLGCASRFTTVRCDRPSVVAKDQMLRFVCSQ